MSIRTRVVTWFKERTGRARQVGTDQFGNRYYQETRPGGRRWVIYNGVEEASKVPPGWNRWLHKTTDELPGNDTDHYAWERPFHPNLTGTVHAYKPAGHLDKGGRRPHATGDYEAWQPE